MYQTPIINSQNYNNKQQFVDNPKPQEAEPKKLPSRYHKITMSKPNNIQSCIDLSKYKFIPPAKLLKARGNCIAHHNVSANTGGDGTTSGSGWDGRAELHCRGGKEGMVGPQDIHSADINHQQRTNIIINPSPVLATPTDAQPSPSNPCPSPSPLRQPPPHTRIQSKHRRSINKRDKDKVPSTEKIDSIINNSYSSPYCFNNVEIGTRYHSQSMIQVGGEASVRSYGKGEAPIQVQGRCEVINQNKYDKSTSMTLSLFMRGTHRHQHTLTGQSLSLIQNKQGYSNIKNKTDEAIGISNISNIVNQKIRDEIYQVKQRQEQKQNRNVYGQKMFRSISNPKLTSSILTTNTVTNPIVNCNPQPYSTNLIPPTIPTLLPTLLPSIAPLSIPTPTTPTPKKTKVQPPRHSILHKTPPLTLQICKNQQKHLEKATQMIQHLQHKQLEAKKEIETLKEENRCLKIRLDSMQRDEKSRIETLARLEGIVKKKDKEICGLNEKIKEMENFKKEKCDQYMLIIDSLKKVIQSQLEKINQLKKKQQHSQSLKKDKKYPDILINQGKTNKKTPQCGGSSNPKNPYTKTQPNYEFVYQQTYQKNQFNANPNDNDIQYQMDSAQQLSQLAYEYPEQEQERMQMQMREEDQYEQHGETNADGNKNREQDTGFEARSGKGKQFFRIVKNMANQAVNQKIGAKSQNMSKNNKNINIDMQVVSLSKEQGTQQYPDRTQFPTPNFGARTPSNLIQSHIQNIQPQLQLQTVPQGQAEPQNEAQDYQVNHNLSPAAQSLQSSLLQEQEQPNLTLSRISESIQEDFQTSRDRISGDREFKNQRYHNNTNGNGNVYLNGGPGRGYRESTHQQLLDEIDQYLSKRVGPHKK